MNDPITMQNHATLNAALFTPTVCAEIDADYKKCTLSQEDVDEFVAMAHSFSVIDADLGRVTN